MRNKKVISFILVLILVLIPFTSQASTEKVYVALGDSIAYGYGVDKEDSYVEIFAGHLKQTTKYSKLTAAEGINPVVQAFKDTNDISEYYAGPLPFGTTSGGMLAFLQMPGTAEVVGSADVITLSVGGNDILSPLMYAQFTTEEALTLLSVTPGTIIGEPLNTKINMAKMQISEAAMYFSMNWPQIIDTIHNMAPKAEVYIMTIYNPLPPVEGVPIAVEGSYYDELYSQIDMIIRMMNEEIKDTNFGYRLVDTYNIFMDSWNISEMKYDYVNFSLFPVLNLDPHPSVAGHQAIGDAHMNAKNANTYK